MDEVIIRQFEKADEVRVFEKGRFEIVRIGGLTIGRATYEAGWKWSEHVRPLAGTEFCEVAHIGLVVSGRATAAMMIGGDTVELSAGMLFHVLARAHDSWVIGDEPYVSLHFLGADNYTRS